MLPSPCRDVPVWLLQTNITPPTNQTAGAITIWDVTNLVVQAGVAAGTLWLAWLAYSQNRNDRARRKAERYRTLVLDIHYPLRDAVAVDEEDPGLVRQYIPWETVRCWQEIRKNRPAFELALLDVPLHNSLRQLAERAEKSATAAQRVNPRGLFQEAVKLRAPHLADEAQYLDFIVRKAASWVTQKYRPEEIWDADLDLLRVEAEKQAEYAGEDVRLGLYNPRTTDHLVDVSREIVVSIWTSFRQLLEADENFKVYKDKKREAIASYRRIKIELERDLSRIDPLLHE